MKKLKVTKEQFEKSKYLQKKYGKLEYVSESGTIYKTNSGRILKFNEVNESGDRETFDSEYALTEDVYQGLANQNSNLILDFADNGREIYVTDKRTDECFTITVTQDE